MESNYMPRVKGALLVTVTIQELLSSVLLGQKNLEIPTEERNMIVYTHHTQIHDAQSMEFSNY